MSAASTIRLVSMPMILPAASNTNRALDCDVDPINSQKYVATRGRSGNMQCVREDRSHRERHGATPTASRAGQSPPEELQGSRSPEGPLSKSLLP
eukprot:scaffold1113_cov379-Prasinococcus_capsulatus_cf.AAC.3